HIHSVSLAHTHTLSHTPTHTHIHTLAPYITHTHTQTHTHILTHTHTHTHIHCDTHKSHKLLSLLRAGTNKDALLHHGYSPPHPPPAAPERCYGNASHRYCCGFLLPRTHRETGNPKLVLAPGGGRV